MKHVHWGSRTCSYRDAPEAAESETARSWGSTPLVLPYHLLNHTEPQMAVRKFKKYQHRAYENSETTNLIPNKKEKANG